jgi:hypothetical protein
MLSNNLLLGLSKLNDKSLLSPDQSNGDSIIKQ